MIHDGEEVRLLNSIDFIEFFSTWGYENVDENDETFLIGNITQGNGSMIQGNRKILRFKNNNN